MATTLHGRLIITGDFNNRSFVLAVPLVDNYGVTAHSVPLRHGDKLRVFNTIADGGVLSQFTVDMFPDGEGCMVQKDTPQRPWVSYFREQMPVVLVRAGEPPRYGVFMKPSVEPGVPKQWMLAPFDGSSSVALQNGDKVTIYRFVKDGNVCLDTTLEIKPERLVRGVCRSNSQEMPPLQITFRHHFERPPHEQMEEICTRGYPVSLTRNL